MTSWRDWVKDIKPGDAVQYRPRGIVRTEQNADLFVAFAAVVDAEEFSRKMMVPIDWETPGIPMVVDVNDV